MTEKSYLRILDEESRIRVKITVEQGAVTGFMIQYELFIKGNWVDIVRYDTSHDFAHKDVLHPDGTKEKVSLSFSDFGSALIFAQEDLLRNYKAYRDTFLKESEK